MVFFGRLGFLFSWRTVLFHRFFVVLFRSLRFLLSRFFMFFVVNRFRRGRFSGSGWRSGSGGVSRKRSRRETHSSGNDQS